MKRHLNTLYVTTQGAYLAKDGETVLVRVEGETKLRVPLLNLDGIVCFGNVGASPFLMGACGKRGVTLSFLSERGRFLARVGRRSLRQRAAPARRSTAARTTRNGARRWRGRS